MNEQQANDLARDAKAWHLRRWWEKTVYVIGWMYIGSFIFGIMLAMTQ